MKFIIFLSLISSTFAINLNCNFTVEKNWANLGDTYTCRGVLENLNERQIYFEGIHHEGKNNSDVEMIYVTNHTNLNFIPDFTSQFKNLKALYLSSNGIKYLNGNELNNYTNLRWISLSRNKIEYVPGNFFEMTPNIETIFMYENQIRGVGKNLLNSLSNLVTANFNDNICINRFASVQSEIQWVILYLTTNCSQDISFDTTEEPTTLFYEPTTSLKPLPQPTCGKGSISARICYLETQNEILLKKNQDLSWKLDDVNRKLDDISENLFGFTQVQQTILMSLPFNDFKYNENNFEAEEKNLKV